MKEQELKQALQFIGQQKPKSRSDFQQNVLRELVDSSAAIQTEGQTRHWYQRTSLYAGFVAACLLLFTLGSLGKSFLLRQQDEELFQQEEFGSDSIKELALTQNSLDEVYSSEILDGAESTFTNVLLPEGEVEVEVPSLPERHLIDDDTDLGHARIDGVIQSSRYQLETLDPVGKASEIIGLINTDLDGFVEESIIEQAQEGDESSRSSATLRLRIRSEQLMRFRTALLEISDMELKYEYSSGEEVGGANRRLGVSYS